jgi:hypothetical protein
MPDVIILRFDERVDFVHARPILLRTAARARQRVVADLPSERINRGTDAPTDLLIMAVPGKARDRDPVMHVVTRASTSGAIIIDVPAVLVDALEYEIGVRVSIRALDTKLATPGHIAHIR